MKDRWIISPRSMMVIAFLAIFLPVVSVSAGPDAVTGDINIPADTPIEKVSDNITTINIQGDFAITEKSFPHTFAPIDAELTVSEGTWDASLSQTLWENVQRGDENPFTVRVIVPEDANIGMTSSFTLYLVFTDTTGSQVGSTQENFMVRVDRIERTSDDDDVDDDDDDSGLNVTEDKSIPFLPIFGIGILVVAVVGLIWFFKNYELVRDTEEGGRIHFREKDTGKILGKRDRD